MQYYYDTMTSRVYTTPTHHHISSLIKPVENEIFNMIIHEVRNEPLCSPDTLYCSGLTLCVNYYKLYVEFLPDTILIHSSHDHKTSITKMQYVDFTTFSDIIKKYRG